VTVQKLIYALAVGTGDAYGLTEDAVSALKCMDVTAVEREDHHFLIEGWLPQAWFDDLGDILETGSRGRVTLLWDDTVRPAIAAPPTSLENPRLVKPFESLVELFSLPGREGFDPTFLTFLVLPAFFGFVIGDFGYGVAFVLIGLYVRRAIRTPLGELASTFTILGGFWSLIFGTVLFADFFGFHVEIGPLRYHVLDKLEDIPQLLLLSLAIGLLHLNLGIAIGFVYERRRAGLRAAFLRKFSLFILEAGLVMLGVTLIGLLAVSWLWIPGMAAIAFAVALISLGGGFVDVIEVPAFVGNIMSYLRLGILGVAEGVLSVAFNQIVIQALLPQGVIGWIVGALVFVVAHAVLMGLALIVVSVHALRLHYVEFYTKFYPLEEIGAARPFEPTVELPRRVEPGGNAA